MLIHPEHIVLELIHHRLEALLQEYPHLVQSSTSGKKELLWVHGQIFQVQMELVMILVR